MTLVDDSYSKSLIHFFGADTSTTFTDMSGKTWTAAGTAQIDTAQYKFGGSALLLDGDSDYIYSADSADWELGATFTVDCWVRFTAVDRAQKIFYQGAGDTDNYYHLMLKDNSALEFRVAISGISRVIVTSSSGLSINTWHHVTVTHASGVYSIYIDGTRVANTSSGGEYDPQNIAASFYIGASIYGSGSEFMGGWVDEFRVSKGIERWTGASFTPPTYEYQTPARSGGRGLIIA